MMKETYELTTVKTIMIVVSTLVVMISTGCNFNNPPAAVDDAVEYYSKEIALNTWIDPDETITDEVEIRVYDETGKLTAVSRNTYEEMDEPGYYMVTRTDVYEVDSDGNQELVEYYLYEYQEDRYQYPDDDGNTVDAVDYLLLRGETYTADDALRLYYDVVYDDPSDTDTANYMYYESMIDKRTSDGEITAAQYAKYVTDPDGEKHFRTEKYFVRNQDDTDLELSQEFASWYDSGGYYDYLYDIYHSFMGEDSSDEFYYFTRYSRNDNGYVYEQADYDYTDDTIPKLSTADYTDETFDDTSADAGWTLGTFAYTPEFEKIGDKATVLTTDYDENGNIILDQRWYRGELIEYTSYTYNSDNELTDECRYTEGGSLLRDKKTIRFRDEVLYGKDYSITETCEYKYYDYSDTESQESRGVRSIGGMRHPLDSYEGLTDTQIKHLQYDRLNNNYRK